jgi:hypothetical protein
MTSSPPNASPATSTTSAKKRLIPKWSALKVSYTREGLTRKDVYIPQDLSAVDAVDADEKAPEFAADFRVFRWPESASKRC